MLFQERTEAVMKGDVGMTLDERKAQAKAEFNRTRGEYLVTGTKEAWIAFCEAKKLCMRLGVII